MSILSFTRNFSTEKNVFKKLSILSMVQLYNQRIITYQYTNIHVYSQMRDKIINENCKNLSASFIDKNNIYKSFEPDVIYSKLYLHEFIWKNIEKWSNKTALVCSITGRSYKYGELRKLCGKFATALRKNHLQPGDTIAIIAPNIPEYTIAIMGASEAGLIITMINPIYTFTEMKRQLEDSGAVAIITVPDKYPTVVKCISENSKIRLPIIVIDDGYSSMPTSNIIKFNDFLSDNIEEFEKTGQKTDRDIKNDTFLLPYSSGTTGLHKGVELTHKNIVMNLQQHNSKEFTWWKFAIGDHQDIIPLILPCFHIYGMVMVLFNFMCSGAKLICVPQFSSKVLLEILEKNRVTLFPAVPPIFNLIANDKRFQKHHMENIRKMVSGAAPLSAAIWEKLAQLFKSDCQFHQGYGCTETSPAIALSNGKIETAESSGYLLPNTNVRIVDQQEENLGRNLGINEIGEIYVRGPQVMKKYHNNSKATSECFEGEWYKTGDLGSFDEAGQLYIQGRLKELIKVQAYQVSPVEIEHVIQSHEKVADVAVIGVPDERSGEIPKAFIVTKPNVKLSEQEIKDFVAKQLAKYKNLGYVDFVSEIPKNSTGKILRRELKNM